MSQISQCPECGTSLRTRADKAAAVVQCPRCGRKFRPSGESVGSHPRRASAPDECSPQEDADFDDEQETLQSRPRKLRNTKRSARSGELQPFLRRWFIACGIVLTIATLFAVGGIFSETLAIVATVICVAAMVGCLVTGTVWTAIDLGKENLLLGISVILVPVIGPAVAFQKKGPALRGAVVLTSLIAPTLLLGLMLLVFYPQYSGAGRQAVRTAKWEDLIHRMDEQLLPETPVVTVAIRVASRPGSLEGLEPRCEALLRPFKCYVHGSLKIDADARIITYQYRGSEKFDKLFAVYLGTSTGAFIPQQRVEADGRQTDINSPAPALTGDETAGSAVPRSGPEPGMRDAPPMTARPSRRRPARRSPRSG